MHLKVKETYLYKDETPFFWLGDTAWLLFDKLSEEDVIKYFKNRKLLGYNVIQIVLVYWDASFETTCGMPHGNKDLHSKEYWDFCYKMIQYAESLDLVIALVPCWGSFVKKGLLNVKTVKKYAAFLSETFQDLSNIIWITGGDVRGSVNLEVFNTFGSELKSRMPDKLVTFHPFGRTASYLWFSDADWIDFHMFQSGHRRFDQLNLGEWDDLNDSEEAYSENNYKYVIKNRSMIPCKPILDAEPSYEGIVQGLHDVKEPYWEARHVRRYAYFSVLEGACGFTYGNNAVIQFYQYGERAAYGVRESWQEGLHSEGGAQMQYMKELMCSHNFTKGSAHPEYILNNKKDLHRTSVFAGPDFMYCYNYYGDALKVSLTAYKNKKMNAFWMNPQNSSRSFIDTYSDVDTVTLRPTRRQEKSNDWVLIFEEAVN